MNRTLEGGTDAAGMVVFDPAALPDDFDAKQKNDPAEQLDELMGAGRLFWINTQGDGDYTLGVYVGSSLPDALKPYAKGLGTCDPFHVPGGRLFFTGVEYVFQADDSFFRKFPHMGEAIELPAGLYRAEFFEFEYPEEFHEDLLRQRLPAIPFRMHRLMNTLAPIGCLSVLGLLASLFLLIRWPAWTAVVIPFWLCLIALPLILSRLPVYKQADAVYKNIQREFPAYGVLLQTCGTA